MSDVDRETLALVRRLAGRMDSLERRVRDQARASQARDRSVDEGAQVIYDEDDEPRAIIGEQADGSYTITTYGGPPPEAPSAPLVATFPGGATITWDGFDASDEVSWPVNLARINVHLSTVPGEPASLDTFIASIESRDGGAVSVAQPDDVTTYCTFVAVTSAGVESSQSAEVAVTGGGIPGGGSATAYPFYTDEPPLGLGMADAGRQWYDTNDGNRLYRWDGDTWEPVLVGPGGTTDDLLAGKRVPLDTAVELEWGVPNPTLPHNGTTSWELLERGWRGSAFVGPSDYGGGLVVNGGIYYSLKVTKATFVNNNGVTKHAYLFALVGSDGTAQPLFTHVNAAYGAVGPMGVSLARIGTEWVVTWGVYVDTQTANTFCRRFSSSTFLQVGTQWKVEQANRFPLAATAAGSDLLLLRYDFTNAQFRVETRAVADGALASTTLIAAADMGGAPPGGAFEAGWTIMQGSFDFGSTRTVISDNGSVRSFIGNVVQAGEAFSTAGSFEHPVPLVGWDGARFVAGRAGYTIRRSTANLTTGTVWVSYAHEEAASGITTAAAPVSAAGVTVGRRSGLYLPHAAMPPDVDETTAPDVTTIYAWSGATQPALADLREVASQVGEDDNGYAAPFTPTPFAFLAAAPPIVSGFPLGAAGAVLSELGDFQVRGDGTGDWPHLRRTIEQAASLLYAAREHSHDDYAPAELQAKLDEVMLSLPRSGRVTVALGGGSNPVHGTQAVAFDPPFPDGTTVEVVAMPYDVVNAGNFDPALEPGVDVNGFTLRVTRTGGSASSATCTWIAVAR